MLVLMLVVGPILDSATHMASLVLVVALVIVPVFDSARCAAVLVPYFPGALHVFVLAVMVVLVLTVMLAFVLVLVLSLVVVPILDSARHAVHAFAGAVGDGLAGSSNLVGW
jgi:hypothetical protein